MLRDATIDDIPAMLALGAAMHAESRYAPMRWSDAKVRALIEGLIASEDGLALVVEDGRELLGGFLGITAEHYFSDDRYATDYALFVTPGRRGGMAAMRMLRAFRAWAETRGAVIIQAGITTGVDLERSTGLFRAAGFEHVGHLFEAPR